ncbi:MAG: UDP-N-acetylmuramoyl-L-alanine--D-glutamate ligase [bacterium]|nr:UDP-N-acetylmuramoyl-L-alanine--D-glutamate ligase [bacterium]
MIELKNKKITVMGLGFHDGGSGVAKFLCEQGAKVTVTDLLTKDKMPEAMTMLEGLPIRYVLGKHEESDFKNVDMVVRNPAIPLDSKYLEIARKNSIPIEMESTLFFKLSPTRNIIAVTGTKGKTTTSHLIHYVLTKAGKKVHLMGNLGKNMLTEIANLNSDSWVVLELSSYQCEGFDSCIDEFKENSLGPKFAVFTNLYPDHLNRYKTMENYVNAKKSIFNTLSSTQFAIINSEGKWGEQVGKDLDGEIKWFDGKTIPHNWLLSTLGEHNRVNAGAVYVIANELKIEESIIKDAICDFPGVEHRLELVRSIRRVYFYNDSTATNPSAVLAGIQSLTELGRPIVLIVGGNDKDMDYKELIDTINKRKLKTAILSGTSDVHFNQIKDDLKIGVFGDLEEAVRAAFAAAKGDGIVLMSPGATSFNIFRDEFDRGNKFKEIVNKL